MSRFRMTKLACFESAGLTSNYFVIPGLSDCVGELVGFGEGAAEGDCATAVPASEALFQIAKKRRGRNFELDLSRLASLDGEILGVIAQGCSRLHAAGTRITFVKPDDCRMDEATALGLEKVYQSCGGLVTSKATPRSMRPRRWLVELGLKVILAVLFYMMVMSVLLATVSHPISREARYAMDAVLAIGASFLTTLIDSDSTEGEIHIPLSKGHMLRFKLNGAPAVFLAVFVIARLYG
jgi:anti-anti-sigma regulatory factor